MIVDLFAGPGGWDEGLRLIGRTDVLGVEWDESACLTAEAAGHRRLRSDVAALDPLDFVTGATVCDLLGISIVDAIVEGLIASPPCQAWSLAGKRGGEEDRAACHELADRMASGDDSTDWREWTDERSPLVCQPVRWVRELRPEWIALEEVPAVLGLWEHMAHIFRAWGYSVWTGLLLAADYGVPQTRTRAILMASRVRTVTPPEPTHAEHPEGVDLFGGGHREKWVSMAEALGWGFDAEPSCTVSAGGGKSGGAEQFANADYRRRLTIHVQSLDRRTNSKNGRGAVYPTPPVGVDRPAPTLTGSGNQVWVTERPATTVVGSFRPDVIAGPGHHATSRQDAPGSIRVTVQEAGVFQSFPADYPWDGLALADHVVRVGFPVVADHAQTDELVREALERGVRFTVLGGGGEDRQVLDGIVRPISVDVVDDLTRLRCGDRAVLRHGAAATEDGISAAEVGVALPALVRVERVTRQSPLLPVLGAEATGDGFAFTVVARWLGGVGELVGGPSIPQPLVVHEAQPLRGVLPLATFDLAESHASSIAEREARKLSTRTKQYEQVGNAVPPLMAAHVLAALGVGSMEAAA